MKHESLALLVVVLAAFGCGNITRRDCPPELTACEDGCLDPMTDNQHCGGCGNGACGDNQQCVAGVCQCLGAKLCGTQCVDTATDEANCGDCGVACTGGKICSGGDCGCPAGLMDCNGTCVDNLNDNTNCGTCGHACDIGTACVGGGCGCPNAQMACATQVGNICVDTTSSDSHCGNCATACTGGKTCQSSSCECTGVTSDCGGTCVNKQTDNSNCGVCGTACTGGKSCQSGSCVCASGKSDCNGVCVDKTNDGSNCGTCGNTCMGGKTCQSSSCQCTGTTSDCGGTCVDKMTDSSNCGMCGTTCNGGKTCQTGNCLCTSGKSDCNGTCVDKTSDNNNCGMCGTVCGGGKTCMSGTCQCTGGLTNCSGTCVNLTLDNNSFCGSCNVSCTGGKTCQSLMCKCTGTKVDCGGTCYDAVSDRSHCGTGCGVCTTAQLCNNQCTSAPTLSFATKWPTPTGWTLPGNTAISMTFALTPSTNAMGITYECRTYKAGTSAPAFAVCDTASSGTAASYKPPIGGDGTYQTDVRYLQNGVAIGSPISYTYYAHTNLNGVPKCTLSFTDAQYFAAAAAYSSANSTTFPMPASPLFTSDSSLALTNPFITIPFKTVNLSLSMINTTAGSTGWGTGWPKDYLLKELSLRHRYVVDGTGKLLLMKRNFEASVIGGCQNLTTSHHAGTFDFSQCEAYVLNINGKGLCIGHNSTNTAPEVKGVPYVAGWFRMRTMRYVHTNNGTTSTRYCGVIGCSTDQNLIYLPP